MTLAYVCRLIERIQFALWLSSRRNRDLHRYAMMVRVAPKVHEPKCERITHPNSLHPCDCIAITNDATKCESWINP